MSTSATLPEATAPIPDQQERLYRFSSWLHVGPGAENCEAVNEETGANDCADPLHFHAWCRLPNQFQVREIREQAFAAKARRMRQLRNEGSDANEILEAELDVLRRGGEATKAEVIDEIVGKDWWQDYLEAAQTVREVEDEKGVKTFEHVDRDQERFKELDATPADQRNADEFEELQRHLVAYGEAVTAELEKIVAPKKAALESKELSDLVDMIREDRIEGQGSEEFMHTYAMQSWLVGTLKTRGGESRFKSQAELQSAPSEVIAALKETFEDLEQTERGVAQGNS